MFSNCKNSDLTTSFLMLALSFDNINLEKQTYNMPVPAMRLFVNFFCQPFGY